MSNDDQVFSDDLSEEELEKLLAELEGGNDTDTLTSEPSIDNNQLPRVNHQTQADSMLSESSKTEDPDDWITGLLDEEELDSSAASLAVDNDISDNDQIDNNSMVESITETVISAVNPNPNPNVKNDTFEPDFSELDLDIDSSSSVEDVSQVQGNVFETQEKPDTAINQNVASQTTEEMTELSDFDLDISSLDLDGTSSKQAVDNELNDDNDIERLESLDDFDLGDFDLTEATTEQVNPVMTDIKVEDLGEFDLSDFDLPNEQVDQTEVEVPVVSEVSNNEAMLIDGGDLNISELDELVQSADPEKIESDSSYIINDNTNSSDILSTVDDSLTTIPETTTSNSEVKEDNQVMSAEQPEVAVNEASTKISPHLDSYTKNLQSPEQSALADPETVAQYTEQEDVLNESLLKDKSLEDEVLLANEMKDTSADISPTLTSTKDVATATHNKFQAESQYLKESAELQAGGDQINEHIKQLKQQLRLINDAFRGLSDISADMIAETRQIQNQCIDDFSVSYEQMHELRKHIIRARRDFNELPSTLDLVEEAFEADLYVAETRQLD